MLVISRRVTERILIGDDITVRIVRIAGNTVRVGIEAPEHIRILRGELSRHAPTGRENEVAFTPLAAQVRRLQKNAGSNESFENQVEESGQD